MTVRLIRLALSDAGTTDAEGVNLTNQEVLDKTEVGPALFAAIPLDSGTMISTNLTDMCHDYSGNLYICDYLRSCVIKVSEGGDVRWIAGSEAGVASNNGTLQNVPAGDARFNQPQGICCDKWGTLYVADTGNNQIRTIKDGKVNVLAGKLAAGFVDGPGTSDTSSSTAQFNTPTDVCVDKAGVVYVADTANHSVRKIMNNGQVVTIAGAGNSGDGIAENYWDANGVISPNFITETATTWPSRRMMFTSPTSISVDLQGNIYVAHYDGVAQHLGYKIKKICPDGQVHLYSGSGIAGLSLGTAGSEWKTCQYTYIYDMDVDESGNVYVADYRAAGRSRIIKIDWTGTPSVVADFDSNTYNAGPWSICTTPGQTIFVGLTY